MRFCVLLVLIFVTQSCKESACNWSGGEITDYGTYCNGDLKIKVYEEDSYLRYEMRDKKDDVAVKYDMNISVVHHWGLFLDNDKNLWVFSSDIGDAVWKRDSLTGEYSKKIFHHSLTRDSVPSELYASSLKRFIK
ncbi:hypothetical protein QQ054_33205 [Oscillatoria amoena NRMC-F 0135]|nr:hypothetical protein [Oscillatoria amoena NRMC-F 0135]